MLECSSMFEVARKAPKKLPKLEKHGIINIRFGGRLDSFQIDKILADIHFIVTIYKSSCKEIRFICEGIFQPKDMFVYVLFETFIYTLRCKYNYNVSYAISKAQSNVHIPGLSDSLLHYFYQADFDKNKMERDYNFLHNKHHFRRIISKDDIEGASKLLGELKMFLRVFEIDQNYGLALAKVASELVDNASEHAKSDCLVDVYVSAPTYHKKNCNDGDYYSISMVVVNFADRTLNYGIQKKIENKNYEESMRYDLVERAFDNHKKYFKNKRYELGDFFNLAAFQDKISGRKMETRTGGTGLTDLIKSLEDKAEEHSCYVLSGNKGLRFEPEYLKYNADNWIGFNDSNDFVNEAPRLDLIVRSKVEFLGTGYNFVLIVKKENE